jgi:hypothetical protein
MDFVGGGMWRFLGLFQKGPFPVYYVHAILYNLR